MTRSSWVIAGAAAGVAAVLLVGAGLVFGGRETDRAGATTSGPAPTTVLSHPADPSGGSRRPDPYPTLPSGQVRGDHASSWMVRTDGDGTRLLVQLIETDCSAEEVRVLGEHPDRVEVEIRTVAKPPPPSATFGPGGSYGCVGFSPADGPHAVVELREPLRERAVVIRRDP
jgi:hypothetical protein